MALADELGIPLVGRQVDGQGHDLQVNLDKWQWDSHRIDKFTVTLSAISSFPGFVKCFLRVPQLLCSFPAAQASKGRSQKIIYKTCETT